MLRIFLHSIGCQTGEEDEDYSVNKECFSKISVVITLFRAFRLLNIGISFRVIRPGLVNLIILSSVPNWYCVSKAVRSVADICSRFSGIDIHCSLVFEEKIC